MQKDSAMPIKESEPVLCIACSVFRSALNQLNETAGINLNLQYMNSMLHLHPEELQQRLEEALERAAGQPVLLLYGDCHSHMREQVDRPGVARVQGVNCAAIFLGTERYRALQKEGVFFLLPEWTLRWREIFEQELGLTTEVAKDMMRELHTKLLYLDTGQIPIPHTHLAAIAAYTGLPYEIVTITPDELLANIQNTLEILNQNYDQ